MESEALKKTPKLYTKLIKAAKEQGWKLELTRGGHLRWQNPDGRIVFTPSSPSDNNRGLKKARADLRKHGGLDV